MIATPLKWLGGQIDVKIEVTTTLVPEGTGLWDVGTWNDVVWSDSFVAFHPITKYCMRVHIRRGQERWGSRFTAGTATFRFDNTTGLFTPNAGEDPWSSPFRLGRLIRVVIIPDPDDPDFTVTKFTGRIDSSEDEFSDAGGDIVTVIHAIDALGDLHGFNPPALETATGVQATDERIDTVLDRMNWSEEQRSLQEGFHTMQTSFLAQTALEETQRAADAEGGSLYADGDNNIVFKNRDWLLGEEVVETFNADDTWTVPPGVDEITVEAWGGGGGGYGDSADSGAVHRGRGGGGGAYARSTVTVTPGNEYAITVGQGGPKAPEGNPSAGNGTSSVFAEDFGGMNDIVVANFGKGAEQASGGQGGSVAASTGDFRSAGGNGGNRATEFTESGGGGGGAAGGPDGTGASGEDGSGTSGGAGGVGTSGAGSGGKGGDVNQSGQAGTAPGGGGGGKGYNSPSLDGGAGANGRVVVTYTPNARSGEVQGAIGYPEGEWPSEETIETFDSSDTWTAPEGVTEVTVEAWGGGGGGGHQGFSSSPGRAGGGGGAYARSTIEVTPGNNYSIVVGAGGVGGSGVSSSNNGEPGGDSSFDSTAVVAKGGTEGRGGTTAVGVGGQAGASTGDVAFSGGDGGAGVGTPNFVGGGGGGSATVDADGNNGVIGSSGGTGGAGEGDGGDGGGDSQDGQPGHAPGGGGGGAGGGQNQSGKAGDGADGRVKLTYELSHIVPTAQIIAIDTNWELTRVRNDIQFARADGTLQTAADAPSQGLYGVRSYSRRDFRNNSDAEVLTLAERHLAAFKDARPRIDTVTIAANADPDNEDLNRLFWDTRFGDMLAVKVQTLHGWSYERKVHVIGIEDDITPDDWVVKLALDDSIIEALQEE